jgi:uncharacterized membrane protein
MHHLIKVMGPVLSLLPLITSCMQRADDEGSPALKVFSALGICLGAIFLVFYIVVKWREKD